MADGDDEGSISDEAMLLRRVHPDQVVRDENTGALRASSGAFRDPELSVDVELMLKAQGLNWQFSLRGFPDHSLVRFAAGVARQLGQEVVHDPIEGNYAHALVKGRKSRPVANELRDASDPILLKKSEA